MRKWAHFLTGSADIFAEIKWGRHTAIVPEQETTPSAAQTEVSTVRSHTNPLQISKIQANSLLVCLVAAVMAAMMAALPAAEAQDTATVSGGYQHSCVVAADATAKGERDDD